MKQPLSPAAVHKQYDEAMTAFRRQIPDPAARVAFGREADGFLRECACGVWQKDQGLTPVHVEYYNAIYCKGNPVPTTLYWELSSQVSEYQGFVLPNFFRRLVQMDLELDKSLSRRFVDTFTLMLLLFAAADGVVSEAEAGFVNACADSMTAYCDRAGVKGGRSALDVQDFVTRRTDQNDRRTGVVEVTPKGAAASDAWLEACRGMERQMLRGFTPQETEQFADYLRRARENLREPSAPAPEEGRS